MAENITPEAAVKKTTDDLSSGLVMLAKFAVGVAVVVVLAYVLKFGGSLSDDPANWGAFGDYIGGVLNPFFAFFALIALLLTIVLQARELELSRVELKNSADALKDSRDIAEQQRQLTIKNSQKEDLFKVIAFIYDEINKLNSQKLYMIMLDPLDSKFEKTEHTIASLFGNQKISGIQKLFPNGRSGDQNRYWQQNKKELSGYIERLYELARYLEMFEQLSGNKALTDYYRIRTYSIAWDMHGQDYIEVDLINKFISDSAFA